MSIFRTIITYFLLISAITCVGEKCSSDLPCSSLNHCSNRGVCKHDPIFPMKAQVIIGLISLIICAALSNSGGIGGGGLYIPFLILVLSFYPDEAIPISKFMIFTGAITSFALGFRQRHPLKNSISIDYNIPYLIVPFLLLGTMVGVTLNKVTPPIIILVGLSGILAFNTYKAIKKFREVYKKETHQKKEDEKSLITIIDNNSSSDDKNDVNTSFVSKIQETIFSDDIIESKQDPNEDLLNEEVRKDNRLFPIEKYLFFLFAIVSELIVTFFKGSPYFPSIIKIRNCSPTYWVTYFTYLPIALIMTYYSAKQIKKEFDLRQKIGYKFIKSDIRWNNKIFIKFPIFAFISGILAGLLGIGGGLILGPLLLELGVHPVVSTSTSNFLVLFTSSSTSTQFIVAGMMNFEFGLACTIASTIGSGLGTLVVQRIVKKTGRFSFLILILAIVLGLSTLCIPGYSIYNIVSYVKAGKNIFSFGNPCSK